MGSGNRPRVLLYGEHPIFQRLCIFLKRDGYSFELLKDSALALQKVVLGQCDILLMTADRRQSAGCDMIRQIRGFSAMPVFVLPLREDEENKVFLLDTGADDVLSVSFSVEEILARIRSAWRRSCYMREGSSDKLFVNGRLCIDYGSASVCVAGEEVHLMPIEYHLLCLLADNVGKVLTYQYILEKVWNSTLNSDLSSLRVYMTSLRKKIEKGPDRTQKYIQTHIGIGYRMLRIEGDG